MTLRTLVTVAALTGAAALAAPALAAASTYCVGSPAGPCEILKPGDAGGLHDALAEAQSTSGDDLVKIGPGTYEGPFAYGSSSGVRIRGSGSSTVIRGVGEWPALTVTASAAAIVSDLEIRMPGGMQQAIGLRIGPGIAERVRVTNPGDSKGTAVMFAGGGDLADSTIQAGAATGIDEDGAPAQHAVRDTVIHAHVGVRARSGTWGLDRLQIHARTTGIASYAKTNVRNSLVRVTGSADAALKSTALYQSVLHQGELGELNADHVTIHGGPHLTYGAMAVALSSASAATINLQSSIVAGSHSSSLARSAASGGAAYIVVGHSNFAPPDPAAVGPSAGLGVFAVVPGTNTNVAPRFLDDEVTLEGPTLDFRLRHDSPLIDRGDPGGVQGEDLGRAARVVDGDGNGTEVADMGAHEYQRRPPIAVIAAPNGGAVAAGAPVAFSAQGSRDADAGDPLSYAWSFGDGASASGASATHAYTTAGTRTVILTVTDPTGLTASATRTLHVEGSGTSVVQAGDGLAPTISALSVTPRSWPAGSANAVPRVRLTLSEPALVRFAIERRAPGRRVKQACRKPDRRNSARPRCVRWAAADAFRRQLGAGQSRVRLPVRLRTLAPGRYRLTVMATDAADNTSPPERRRLQVGP
jgi:PKD domain